MEREALQQILHLQQILRLFPQACSPLWSHECGSSYYTTGMCSRVNANFRFSRSVAPALQSERRDLAVIPDPIPGPIPDPIPVLNPDPILDPIPHLMPDPIPAAIPDPILVLNPDPILTLSLT